MGAQSSILYGGERDAFVPIDFEDDELQPVQPNATPSISVQPKVTNHLSPPSVISSSDSSYGTCGSSTPVRFFVGGCIFLCISLIDKSVMITVC